MVSFSLEIYNWSSSLGEKNQLLLRQKLYVYKWHAYMMKKVKLHPTKKNKKIKKKPIALWNIYIYENIYSTIPGILSSWYHALVLKINYNKKYSWTFKIGAVRIWGRNTKSVHVSIFPMEVLASSRRRRR